MSEMQSATGHAAIRDPAARMDMPELPLYLWPCPDGVPPLQQAAPGNRKYMSDTPTPSQARHYIANFAKHVVPGTEYVDFPSGRIYLNQMTDEQAVKVAIGLMEIEAQAGKGPVQ
jgi:hypothetical protein